jgi:hypothetical protein
MAATAQTLINAVGPLDYDALDRRETLLCIAAAYAVGAGLTAQQAANGAAAQRYAALSDLDLKKCLLYALQG